MQSESQATLVQDEQELVLNMEGIYKAFPGVQALDCVDFQLQKGEVHVLLGENGAGKSTLVKILSGAHLKDEGKIQINGTVVEINNPNDSTELGIRMVYQDLNLLPRLSIGENIFLENLPKHRFTRFVNWEYIYEKSSEILSELDFKLNPRTWIAKLSVADRQMVEIAKALMFNASIIILDEPTSSLSEEDTQKLFSMIRKVKTKGVSIIYISHRLPEVMQIGDRCTVLRDGKKVGTVDLRDCTVEDLIEMMLGKKMSEKFGSKVEREIGNEILRVENLTSKGLFHDISFSLQEGEILGISGLVGAGKTEVAHTVFGAKTFDSGKIIVNGKVVHIDSPERAISEGICLLPEDRKNEGLCPRLSVKHNISLPSIKRFSIYSFIQKKREQKDTQALVERLNIKTPSINRWVQFLSGGNQQRTVLAKWLMMDVKIYIFDEPTRGIDVGAKTEVYNLIRILAKQKKGVIVISTEIPEIIAISDRILVMCNGEINARLKSEEATKEKILYYATGHKVRE